MDPQPASASAQDLNIKWLPGIFFRDNFYSFSFIYQICLFFPGQLLSENQVNHRGTWVSWAAYKARVQMSWAW